MRLPLVLALALPFLGTALGSGCVFFLNRPQPNALRRGLTGFAAGVMVAASVWSLIIPALNQSAALGTWAFFPALAGIWAGFLFLLLLDRLVPHLHWGSSAPEGTPCGLGSSTMLVLAVALHNLPEGMAVGVVAAGLLLGTADVTATGTAALALGIGLQNLPEGAIISMPLRCAGLGRGRAFLYGVLSGALETLGAVLTLLLARWVAPVLPFALSLAAGAMLFVVVEELIPETSQGEHSDTGTLMFALGFTLMMVLDVTLG